MSKLYPLLSILLALALALIEWAFFFQGANWEGPSGPFAPDRLGFDLAWLTLIYLSFQLLSIPPAIGARERFIGVLDGMASVVPFGVSLVVIFGKPELLGTPQRWEAAFLLLSIAAIDLFGGYMFNIALSRRTMDVANPAIWAIGQLTIAFNGMFLSYELSRRVRSGIICPLRRWRRG